MRNNGLVSIGVGTWRRPRTTSLSILLLFSLCISQSDKHSIIKIALQSELEASLLLPDGRHVFFFGFFFAGTAGSSLGEYFACLSCIGFSTRPWLRIRQFHGRSCVQTPGASICWLIFPPPICVVDNNILSAVLSTRSIFMVLREKKPYIIITLAKDRATMAL